MSAIDEIRSSVASHRNENADYPRYIDAILELDERLKKFEDTYKDIEASFQKAVHADMTPFDFRQEIMASECDIRGRLKKVEAWMASAKPCPHMLTAAEIEAEFKATRHTGIPEIVADAAIETYADQIAAAYRAANCIAEAESRP